MVFKPVIHFEKSVHTLAGSVSKVTSAEHQASGSPRMSMRDFDAAAVSRSHFEPGIDVNGSAAIWNYLPSVDGVNMSGGVDVVLVALSIKGEEGVGGGEGGEEGGRREV